MKAPQAVSRGPATTASTPRTRSSACAAAWAAAVVVALAGATGCAAQAGGTPLPPSSAAGKPAAPPAPPIVASGMARVGDRTRCPVSGEEFTVKAGSPHADYQGKRYYFCCPGCVEKFTSNPGSYAGQAMDRPLGAGQQPRGPSSS